MTRTYVIQPDVPALGAAERAARFDDLTAIIELPATGERTLPGRLYVDWRPDGRFVYEWDKNPDVRDACGFHRAWPSRAEVIELIDGKMPQRMQDAILAFAEWLAAARAREAAIEALTPAQRALAHAAAEQLRTGEVRSNSNREQPTKASRKRDRDRVLAQQSEAAAQRAALLP